MTSASVFKIKLNIFRFFDPGTNKYVMTVNNFQGELSDIAAKTQSIGVTWLIYWLEQKHYFLGVSPVILVQNYITYIWGTLILYIFSLITKMNPGDLTNVSAKPKSLRITARSKSLFVTTKHSSDCVCQQKRARWIVIASIHMWHFDLWLNMNHCMMISSFWKSL